MERGNGTGVHVHDGGRGIFTQNSIRLNSKAGVVVRTSSEAILDANLISDGKATGVYVYDNGKVLIRDGNKIERNASHGVAVRDGGVLEMTGSRIVKSGQNGLYVYASDLIGNGRALRNDDNCVFGRIAIRLYEDDGSTCVPKI